MKCKIVEIQEVNYEYKCLEKIGVERVCGGVKENEWVIWGVT